MNKEAILKLARDLFSALAVDACMKRTSACDATNEFESKHKIRVKDVVFVDDTFTITVDSLDGAREHFDIKISLEVRK